MGSEICFDLEKKQELGISRLNSLKERALKNEVLIQEVTSLCFTMQMKANSERLHNLQMVDQSTLLKKKYEQLMKKLMSLVSELSIFQARKFQMIQQKQELETAFQEVQLNQLQARPPLKDSELNFLKMVKSEIQFAQLKKLRKEQSTLMKAPQSSVKTFAPQRNTAYLDKFGLPKPYGIFKPLHTRFLPKIQNN